MKKEKLFSAVEVAVLIVTATVIAWVFSRVFGT